MNSVDYWIQLGVSQIWALVIVAAIFAFGLGMGLMRMIDSGQMKVLKERKDLAEERLQQVREQASADRGAIAQLQAQVARAMSLVRDKAPAAAIEPVLRSVEADTGALVESNRATTTILSLIPPRTTNLNG